MPGERFRFIEGAKPPLPEDLKAALGNLGRFGNLEISGKALPKKEVPKRICPGCGQSNEPEALECASCRRVLEPEPKIVPAGAALAIVLDGKTYKSTDPDVPEDVAVLMKQIREKGYSTKLVADWRSWRATRRSRAARAEPHPSKPAPVLRINGRLLRWSDGDLPDELRVLFSFIATNGVTDGLINHLKELGYGIRYDPAAEGGLGLLDVRTEGSQLSGLQKRGLRFVAIAAVVWILLTPLRNMEAFPDYLRIVLYLLPFGMALSWSAR